MKKNVLLTSLIVLFVTVNVTAQIEFGVNTGVFQSPRISESIISRSGDDRIDSGFYVGMFAEKKLSEKISLQSGLSYFYNVSYEDQIEIPLELKYKLTKKFYIFFGPNVSFLIDKKELDKSFNFGVALGVSYKISDKLLINARYNYGLTKLYNISLSSSTFRLNRFQIGLSYKFN